jgi:ketosteroid isomerase-like protein
MKAISEGDSAALFGMYAPNARFWQVGRRLSTAGWHDMEATGRIAAKVFSRMAGPPNFSILSVTAEGDRVAVEAESHTHLADGRPYENQYHFLIRFDDDGKVLEFKEYLDTLYAFETLYAGKTDL